MSLFDSVSFAADVLLMGVLGAVFVVGLAMRTLVRAAIRTTRTLKLTPHRERPNRSSEG